MIEWAAVVIVAIIAAYKLIDHWIDLKADQTPERETDTYTVTELAHRDPGNDDGGYRYTPDIQAGLQRNGDGHA